MDYTISIHAPREGGDPEAWTRTGHGAYFNPRPPRGGRPHTELSQIKSYMISIHAPREGGDKKEAHAPTATRISIHAPREGGDQRGLCHRHKVLRFQSTPPARGATDLSR